MKKIHVKFIPHDEQRYETVGDYWVERNGTWQIRISKMSDERSELAVLIHELIEMFEVVKAGLTIKAIDDFDKMYEEERARGMHGPYDEPGADMRAPYFDEHKSAEDVERFVCGELGISWSMHSKNVNILSDDPVGQLSHGFERQGP